MSNFDFTWYYQYSYLDAAGLAISTHKKDPLQLSVDLAIM